MADNMPTPATVRTAHAVTRMRDRQEYDQRVHNAHRNGYRGPLTRAELAAMAERAMRDANS